MELILAVVLGTCVSLLEPKPKRKSVSFALCAAFTCYSDAAILFSFSIQLAAVILLAQKDYGISANDFGMFTVEVTWAAAVLSMLPLILILFVDDTDDQLEVRKILISISWVLFLYTFLARMIANFGTATQVGTSTGQLITPAQWSNIQTLCFNGPAGLSSSETTAYDVFAVTGSLLCCIAILAKLAWDVVDRQTMHLAPQLRTAFKSDILTQRVWKLILVANVGLWGIPQVWGIFRFRQLQLALSNAVGVADQDSSWSFGQIIAVVVFLPVFVEVVDVYAKGVPSRLRRVGKAVGRVEGSDGDGRAQAVRLRSRAART